VLRLAVTGGTGFIGTWFLKLVPKEHEVIVLGRDFSRKELYVYDRKFKYIPTNYSKDELNTILKNVNAVVHMASVRTGASDFGDFLSNITVSENLFNSCMNNSVSNIVCLSTISVYSMLNHYPWEEKQLVSPESFYGITKATMENLGEYYNTKKNMKIKSLRVAQVLGCGEREGFMLMTFINNAFKKKTLNVYGNGAGKREYIYVKDVVAAILAALDKPEVRGVYNIGTGKNISHLELAEIINDVFGNKGNLKFIKDKEEDVTEFLMDISLAKKDLGWASEWCLKDALVDMKDIMYK
jgi:UDP-glucose 4-epimerase